MSILWPKLPSVVADREFLRLSPTTQYDPSTSHSEQTWSPIGGRVKDVEVRDLITALSDLATAHGFPAPAGNDARIAFDRAASGVLRKRMDLDWAEATDRDLWSFTSLVALPHLTHWRFGIGNRERWVASDLTRHTWGRLWWQAVVFEGHENLLAALSESDLNQLLERRSIGGDPRFVQSVAAALLAAPDDVPRRDVTRQLSLRLRRLLAFLDVHALTDAQVHELCRDLLDDVVAQLRSRA